MKGKISKKIGYVPSSIKIMTWFAFLLAHGVRPFRHPAIDFRVSGLFLDEGRPPRSQARKNNLRYYCTADNKVHSGRLAELTIDCDLASDGEVFDRIGNIFDLVCIDEVQDMSGYDYEVIRRLADCCNDLVVVGDPRQRTYCTNFSSKNSSYETFFDYAKKQMGIEPDSTTLNDSFRCPQEILSIANKLFPEFPPTNSAAKRSNQENIGIHIVPASLVREYIRRLSPVQLRWSSTKDTDESAETLNMGDSKGLSFERVLLYPTAKMEDWFLGNTAALDSQSAKSKLYVALTRARYSVGVVLDSEKARNANFDIWEP